MELNFTDIVSLFIVFVSLLFAAYLLTMKSENYTSNLLIALFLILNAQDSSSIFSNFVYPNFPGWGMLMNSTVFFTMPLLYLYILSVIYSDFSLKGKHLIHCIPFIINAVVFIPRYYAVDFDEKWIFLNANDIERMPEVKISYLLIHSQIAFYLIASFLAIRKYKNLLLENYSNASMFSHKWMFQLILIIAIESVVAGIKNVFMFLHIEKVYYYTLLLTALMMLGIVCWLVLKALQSPQLFRGIDSNLQLVRTLIKESNLVDTNPDQSSTKKDAEIQEKIDMLEKFMIDQKLYLDASLTMYDLSKHLNMPVRELSLLINHDLDQHFFDFVNGYRIRQAMEMLRDPDKKEYTVLEILYDVGFNSKSSFNTAFKKLTRLTPTEYRLRHLKAAG
jgi:AraC-like DNA-binding protein